MLKSKTDPSEPLLVSLACFLSFFLILYKVILGLCQNKPATIHGYQIYIDHHVAIYSLIYLVFAPAVEIIKIQNKDIDEMKPTKFRIQMIKDNGGRYIPQLWLIPFVTIILITPPSGSFAEWPPLPDTGQTACYDANNLVIPCPSAGTPLFGQDAQYNGATPDYVDNTNQTITDLQSGLIWTRSGKGLQFTWQDAISYCDELVFANQSDWRLPGKFELESIVDYGKFFPASNKIFDCEGSFYWSSTTHMGNSEYAWSVFCNDGADHWVHKSNKYYVRCVRTVP